MIANLLSAVTNIIIHLISTLGYPGVFLLMAMHSAAIPVPSEVVMPFAGYLVSQGRFNYFAVVIVGTLGNLAGGSIIYVLAKHGGRKLVEKYEHAVFVSKSDLERVEKFFHRFGAFAIFLGRCMPIVATFISIPAGLSKIKYWKFAVFTFFGAIIWNFLLVYIGMKLGQNWTVLRDKLHNFELLILVLIVIGAIWWIYRHIKNRVKA
jgi:membrane protein DedA with SNARE-associated domain